jgi:trypsin
MRRGGSRCDRARAWFALAAIAFGCSGCGRSCQVEPTDPPYSPDESTGGQYVSTAGAGGQGTGAVIGTGGRPVERPCEWVPARAATRALALERGRSLARVVGGGPASTLYPGIAAVETEGGFQFCACTLVAPDRCVTAAHCQQEPGDVVHAGTLDLRVGGVRSIVKEARFHPDWHSIASGWDIGVLHLATPIEGVDLAELAPEPVESGEWFWVAGWGRTEESGNTTPLLHHARLPAVDWALCQIVYGTLTPTDMCAGGDGTDACQGDSGGPLYTADGRVVGVTSRGIGCGRPRIPGIWTAIAKVYEWVLACVR